MYYFLCDKSCQKPEKYKPLEGSFQNGVRHGRGEQLFENGCVYRGEFQKDAIHGKGEFTFPEGTTLVGFFDSNRFRKGTITLSIGIKIGCIMETDYETCEDHFKEFQVMVAPECVLYGHTSSRGSLESAQIVLRGEPVMTYSGSNMVFKIPGDPKTHLVVSKLWFYLGEVTAHNSDGFSGPIFDGTGSQVWYTGIGYNQGSRTGGQLHGIQLMLRHCSGLQFFREMKYSNGKFLSSITFFNNGLIFSTEEDYFKGILKIIRANGNEADFDCALNDYSSLKLGVLKSREDDAEIKLFEKDGKLLFGYKGKEHTLDEFKNLLG